MNKCSCSSSGTETEFLFERILKRILNAIRPITDQDAPTSFPQIPQLHLYVYKTILCFLFCCPCSPVVYGFVVSLQENVT